MITEKEAVRISRFLSLVLRHQPETIGLMLDENGWADVNLLIEKCNQQGVALNRELIEHVVATNTKKRFSFNEQKDLIRANQGHSIEVDLALSSQVPPEILFHGTAERFVSPIKEHGLIKQQRQHVHLSAEESTAVQVGQRHGKPFVFSVLTGQMHQDGFVFYLSDNGVWLTDHVPAKYLSF
ncbi:RNA 2'-phosphotransferase [Niabella yanshanensis]|uniref:Probable RNA 2'-phosphotransferase n=1 Tax=Niabella yanshanensis TaxID=577386 RepID=A0ABZ0W3I9_9BACT|nr:RNA 2'-phosphotransferase [Niabella yanshanensis]WQD36641.1 RNA 2'-phosphotransferase [Niabella yanshanensis]